MGFFKNLLSSGDDQLKSPEDRLFYSLFSIIGQLVIADGTISEEEVLCVENFIRDGLKLSPEREKQVLRFFRKGQKLEIEISDLASQIYLDFKDTPVLLRLVLDILVQVSVADGEFSETEQQVVDSVAGVFGISAEEYREFRFHFVDSETVSGNDVYYSLIACSPKSSDAELKLHFAKFLARNGSKAMEKLPAEFILYAKNRFQRVEQAFKIVLNERGLHL